MLSCVWFIWILYTDLICQIIHSSTFLLSGHGYESRRPGTGALTRADSQRILWMMCRERRRQPPPDWLTGAEDQRLRRRGPEEVRGGGSGDQTEGARRPSVAKALAASTKATESRRANTGEGRPRRRLKGSRNFLKDGSAGPWTADGLTVAAHQEKAVGEEGTQIILSGLC